MHRPRVLAVDDSARNLAIIQKSLGAGVRFSSASSGEEALGLADRVRPDIMLLDVMMPGIDGYETCRRMRARPEFPNLKIIMVSARVNASDRLVGYAAGADDYVVKPFDPDELLAKVKVYARLKTVEEMDTVKSDLLTLLGHETRTPLTTILTPLALLRDAEGLSDEHRELVEIAEAGGHRLLHFIERACFVTQMRVGSVPLRFEQSECSSLLGQAIQRVQDSAIAQSVTLRAKLATGICVNADQESMIEAFMALLDNAIKFSAAGDEVGIELAGSTDCCAVTITDHGPGIAADLIPRLFQSFAVADIRHHHSGYGLGLALAHAVAAQHGGSVSVESVLGAGSTFRLELPVALPQRAAA